MKQLLIPLEDAEYDLLCLARGDENKSWKSFLLDMAAERIQLSEAAVEVLNAETILTGRLVIRGEDGDTVID